MTAPDLLIFAVATALTMAAIAARRDLNFPLLAGLPALFGLTAATSGLAWRFGFNWRDAAFVAALCSICALIAEVDRRRFLIPDALVLALLVLAAAQPLGMSWTEMLAGAAALAMLLLGVRFGFARLGRVEALGLGDVKFAVAMGALLGAQQGLLALALAGVATLSVATPALARERAQVEARLPFGVGLAAALAVMCVLRLWGAA